MSATSPLLLVAVVGFSVAFSFASLWFFLSSVTRRRRRRFGRLPRRFLLRKLAPTEIEARQPHDSRHPVLEGDDADGLGFVHPLPVVGIGELRIGRKRTGDVGLRPLHTARVQDEHTAVDEVVLARQRVADYLINRRVKWTVAN